MASRDSTLQLTLLGVSAFIDIDLNMVRKAVIDHFVVCPLVNVSLGGKESRTSRWAWRPHSGKKLAAFKHLGKRIEVPAVGDCTIQGEAVTLLDK